MDAISVRPDGRAVLEAGIAGLVTALALVRAGIEVEIFEQSQELRELGVGINLLPHAVKELAALGLLTALDKAGIRTREQMAEVIAFFRARKGRAYGFRFRDWTDFEATDQALVATADPLVWKLAKTYASGPSADLRLITKPEAGSVLVRVSGALVPGISVDHLAGIVTFLSAPPLAQPYADFRFDVPCRFDTDHLPVVASAYHLQQVSSIAIVESDVGDARTGVGVGAGAGSGVAGSGGSSEECWYGVQPIRESRIPVLWRGLAAERLRPVR